MVFVKNTQVKFILTMENNIYPKASTTRSYTRKVNLGNYESEDYFMSASYSWFDEYPSIEEYKDKGTELLGLCEGQVMKEVKEKHPQKFISDDKVNEAFQMAANQKKDV